MLRRLQRIVLLIGLLVMAMAWSLPTGAAPADNGQLRVQTSMLTHHYSADPEHNNDQDLINLEWSFHTALGDSTERDVRWIAGAAHFKNSFSQKSQYVYAGSRWHYRMSKNLDLYLKLTAGLIHGYRGEYQRKIPFNHLGFAPAVLPGLGLEYRRVHLELIPFGAAGMMLGTGIKF